MKKLKKVLALITTAAMLSATAVMPVFAADTAQFCDEPQQVTAELTTAVDEDAEVVEDVAELTDANEGIMTLSDDNVATIGDIGYTSLSTAVTAANSSGSDVTIKMQADVSMDSTYDQIQITNTSAAVTIDLNGHTIKSVSGNTVAYLVQVSSSAKLIVTDTSEEAAGSLAGGVYTSGDKNYYGYGILSYGDVEIQAGTVSGYYAVYNGSGASLTVTDGTITGRSMGILSTNADVNISGGTISTTLTNSVAVKMQVGSDLTMTGGVINSYGDGVTGVVGLFGCNLDITGGTITVSTEEEDSASHQEQGVAIYGYSSTYSSYGTGTLTIGGDAQINAQYGVCAWYYATVNIEGGEINSTAFAACTNGTDYGITINIYDGTLTSTATGMYLPAMDSTTNIYGGTITGTNTGIEIRAGVLNIYGGTISSTTSPYSSSYNGNGSTTVGAGIAVSQHTTNDEITVNIYSGTISGYIGVLESNTVSGNTSAVTIKISGDATVSTTDTTNGAAVYSASVSSDEENTYSYGTSHTTVTITSGTYNTDVTEYTASNHYYDETTGSVLQSSTIVDDDDYYYLDDSTVKITLDDLETNLKSTYWTDTTDYHTSGDCVYDATEVAEIYVVLGEEDAADLKETYSGTITSTGDDDFAVDISVVKKYSDGKVETVPVTNQTVTITTPTSVSSSSVTVYHVTDETTPTVTSTSVTPSGNTITFTADSFSPYYFGLTLASVTASDITSTVTVNLTEVKTGVPGTYYITLDAEDGYIINRFMAAELAFVLDDTLDITNIGAVSITPAEYISVISSGNGEYEFNVKDTNGVVYGLTGDSILLGTMTITGSGYFSLSLLDDTELETNTANQAQTAEYSNNIVYTYTLTDDTLAAGAAPLASGEITLAQTQLTINVLFPNTVSAQAADYNDMTVTVSGMGVDKTISLGGDELTADDVDITSVSGDADYTDATGYTTTVTVYRNYATTLKFEGAGYRTYRTSVTPSSGTATVTVWNNAMSQDMYVATSTDNAMGDVTDDVTFLAGDIVANNVIDLWDLSAVVSYFGKANDITTADTFVMYDLNRDGKVDSRDIAMVLVSWNY